MTNFSPPNYFIKREWRSMILDMDATTLGNLIKAVTELAFDGVVYDGDDKEIRSVYMIMGDAILKEQQHYYEKCERNRKAVNKRYGKKSKAEESDDSKLDITAYDDHDAF